MEFARFYRELPTLDSQLPIINLVIPLEPIDEAYRDLLPEGVLLGLGSLTRHLSEDLLSKVEREEYRTFTNLKRRDEYLATRNLIGELADQIGLDRTLFEIRKDGLGKPYGVHNNSRYNLSLAHSDQKVLCGISPVIQIGVDLEPVVRRVNERLRGRMLNAEEKEPLKEESLVRIWTLKEAMVKLEGKGLRTNLNQITIKPTGKVEFTGIFHNDKTARICSFQHDGYWIAVAHYL